ncbi:MAG: SUF system NifU family Fe-S cluster assembly protein [Candidatus Nanopelagicales bacterium]|nr:SUF system NifU family Fe-S cluster assembly protein [Candidatus Nanopelagicales bacterium]MDZ4250624.1 SUF system NifU family Fe-S cluster assembly protein [Candidatus Nanopelagicales bacterium]
MMGLESMYQDVILDHYRNPQGRGLRDPFDAEVSHVNPTCGDEITLRVAVVPGEDPLIQDVSYEGEGCSISQAAASVMYEETSGRKVSDAMSVMEAFVDLMRSQGRGEPDEAKLGDLVAFQGVAQYPARVKCALLPWMALKDALAQAGAAIEEPEVQE